jgi:hypothetical protein
MNPNTKNSQNTVRVSVKLIRVLILSTQLVVWNYSRSESGRLGPDPDSDPGLNKSSKISTFLANKSNKYCTKFMALSFLPHEPTLKKKYQQNIC